MGLLRGSEETRVVEMPGRPRHPVPIEMMTAMVGWWLTVAGHSEPFTRGRKCWWDQQAV